MASQNKSARGNAYYRDLLERKHPDVFLDLQAGKHKTVAEALKVAGVKKARTPLQEMMNAWGKATPAERDEFLLRLGIPGLGAISSARTAAARRFAIDRCLETDAIEDIRGVMAKRNLKMGDLMQELGRNRLNASVGMAMSRGSRLQNGLLDDLEDWLKKHAGISLPS